MATEITLEQQGRMVTALETRLAAATGSTVSRIETHISFVLVCGAHAYKFKKALRTPFLDQSTLSRRQHACLEELRLNRRLAPELYLAALPITGSVDEPALDGQGAAIDWAVQMKAFAQDGLWERLAARGQLSAAHIDELASLIARFHDAAARAEAGGRLGSPDQVREPLRQSLDELDGLTPSGPGRDVLQQLRVWEAEVYERLRPVLSQRLAQGRVRECHGDLHLGNVTQLDGRVTVFDGIEFNDDFRWIDVMSEVAFMAMDLHAQGLHGLAHRFINGYLEHCGDYDGVRILNYHLVHRALVRAKVHGLRAAQCDATQSREADAERTTAERYLHLALDFCRREHARPALMITHGYSGSGKSTLTQALLEASGAVRIRADVERKRLAGLQPLDRPDASAIGTLYGRDMAASTYAELLRLAEPVLDAGCHVILDATFLRRAPRDAARAFAARRRIACAVLDFKVDTAVLGKRLRERARRGADASDADEAVLQLQLQFAESLWDDEAGPVFQLSDPRGAGEVDWAPVLQWLRPAG